MNLIPILCTILIFISHGAHGFMTRLIDKVYDYFESERCSYYFTADINPMELMDSINAQVFGQPFVTEALLPLIISHRKYNHNHHKSLVLSFHGSQGTGKNFVAKIIVEHLFKKGFHSDYVKYFNGRKDFLKRSQSDQHIIDLYESISKQLRKCKYSVFIFDEIEKFPESILDGLKFFVDYNSDLSGYKSENAIFIFLSNSGMKSINQKSLELWQKNLDRRDYRLSDFQSLLAEVYNSDGALKYSELIRASLIDLTIPFLPLEKEHVVQCIRNEAKKHNEVLTTTQITDILEYVDFEPEDTKTYARNGCKNIKNSLMVVLAKPRKRKRNDEF